MVAELQLRGVYVPVVTPFDDRGKVAVDALERLTDDVLPGRREGVHPADTDPGDPSAA